MPQLIDPLVMATPGNAIHPMLQLTRIVGATIVWCMLAHEINLALRQHTHTPIEPRFSSHFSQPVVRWQVFLLPAGLWPLLVPNPTHHPRHLRLLLQFTFGYNAKGGTASRVDRVWATRATEEREREREKTIRERSVCIHTHTLKERSQSESVILNKPTHTDPMPRYVGQLLASIANSSR